MTRRKDDWHVTVSSGSSNWRQGSTVYIGVTLDKDPTRSVYLKLTAEERKILMQKLSTWDEENS